MSLQTFVDLIVSFVKEHEAWATLVIFLVAFMESFCFLSILWPGTAILAGITALLAASGAKDDIVLPAIVAAGLGGTLGYAISYWIGYRFKQNIHGVWPFRSRPELILHGESFFERWGGWSVFFGHFFGPVRAIIPVVAGMFRMPQLPFQIANTASAFLWAGGVIAPSFFLVSFREEIVASIAEHQTLIALTLAGLAFLNAVPMPLLAIPTLILFLATGAVFLYAGGSLSIALLAATVGAFLGDIMAYLSGRTHDRDLHTVWPSSWSPEAADQATVYMLRRGALGLIPAKFHTTLRSFAPLAAGAHALPWGPFLAASLVSAGLWSAGLLAPVPLISAFFAP